MKTHLQPGHVPGGVAASRRLLLSGLLLPLLSTGLGAQQPAPTAADSTVTLNFQDADLRLVIGSLAELAGIALTHSGLPSKTVTLRTSAPIPRRELRGLLETVARANGLSLVQEGSLVRIEAPSGSPGAAAEGGWRSPATTAQGGDGVQLYVYRLRHVRAEEMARTLRELFGLSERAGSSPLPLDARAAERRERRQRVPNPLAPPVAPAPVPAGDVPRPSPGAGLQAELRGTVQIIPDPLTNALLIRADADDYATIRGAVEELDVRPLQVLIEVLIAEVRRDRQFELGVEVAVPDQREPRTGVTLGGELKSNSPGDVVLRILNVGAVNADVVLRALASSGKVTVLSRPVVLAQNNQQARILVGSQRPFVQIQRALPTDGAVRDQVIQYRDVGTELDITPTINPDGYVTLEVRQEVSGATTETQFGAPIISTREVETQLFVKDRHTAVIGGLVDHQREAGHSGIPLLQDLPLLGALFRSSRRRGTSTELFILLTPHVIRTDEEMQNATDAAQESTRELENASEKLEPIESTAPPQRRRRP